MCTFYYAVGEPISVLNTMQVVAVNYKFKSWSEFYDICYDIDIWFAKTTSHGRRKYEIR